MKALLSFFGLNKKTEDEADDLASPVKQQLLSRFAQLETENVMLRRRLDRMEARYYNPQVGHAELERARGYIDEMYHDGRSFVISGWMLLPEKAFDSIELYINGECVAEAPVGERKDLASYLPYFSHASKSGFRFSVELSSEALRDLSDICLVGLCKSRKSAKMETWFTHGLDDCLPTPPKDIMLREVNYDNRTIYLIQGLKSCREFWTAACEHADPSRFRRMLDWGCGAGRVTGFFAKFSEVEEVCGCDVDAEAIAWCNDRLSPAEFSVTPFYPPLPYDDESFDLVISFSVLTHLSRKDQLTWLEEIKRILSPNGLFLATVHGEFAASCSLPGGEIATLLERGIIDEAADHNLDGVAPSGYYRSVFQTREYTEKTYSQHLDVVAYHERGGLNFQDMVVLRKGT